MVTKEGLLEQVKALTTKNAVEFTLNETRVDERNSTRLSVNLHLAHAEFALMLKGNDTVNVLEKAVEFLETYNFPPAMAHLPDQVTATTTTLVTPKKTKGCC